ncbi:MAG: phage portal protein [Rickettsiales bacterium]|nr:MAG: phage portal protein [Rickettsiales bacterium]
MKLFKKKGDMQQRIPQQVEMKSYYQPLGKAIWSEQNYDAFCRNGYAKNVIVARCINLIAKNAGSIPFAVYDKRTNRTLEEHYLTKLLKKPNPTQSGIEFFENLYAYKLIAGNSYILNNMEKELYLLRPDRITIISDNCITPLAYKYKVGKEEKIFYVDKITGKSDILHIKNFNPLNDYYGLSPIEIANYAIEQHNEASKWNKAMLQSAAKPSGALMLKSENGNSTYLTDEQYNKLKEQIDNDFSGAENAGRPLLLEGCLEWKQMSLSPIDMDFLNTKNNSAREIALAFGVPAQLLGINGDNTYNNMAEARLSFWEETILPLLDSTIETFNNYFCDGNIALYYDKDKISALSSKQEIYWNKIANANFLSSEEKKKLLDI